MLKKQNSLRILFAEDHPAIQGLIGSLIKGWGFHTDIASNGLEAVRYAEKTAMICA
ncbi:MAG: response regulator [Desulfobacterales bacterium]|nr:response regulator [Desulfobacterales bacterium]MDD4073511.1 response regulator [Desulfobacterales bacterium]MDD4394157.1 response regulator [Desulfobacterales bacterium]